MSKILFMVLFFIGVFWFAKGMVDENDLLSIKGILTLLLADRIV